LKHFKSENLNIEYIQKVETESGVANIIVNDKGENQIIVIPGANHKLEVNKILDDMNKIDNLKIIVAQFEIQPEIISKIFEYARREKITTVLNPAPAMELSDDLIKNTDWLIPNETEFIQIHPNHKNPTDEEIKFLSNKLQLNLIVTLGEKGAKVCLKNGELSHIQTKKVTAIDTTAAGDTFVGSFTALLALGWEPLMAVEKSCELASITVTRLGAQNSLPTSFEIKKLINLNSK
jgi:ribokinase